MAIIKQISVYNGSAWNTNDIGANAKNISLTNSQGTSSVTLVGSTNVQGVLDNIMPAAKLTASRALITNSSQKLAVSNVTSTQLEYLSGITNNIQTQLDGKVSKTGDTMTGSLVLSQPNMNFDRKSVILNVPNYEGIDYVDSDINIIKKTAFYPLSSQYNSSSSTSIKTPTSIIDVQDATHNSVVRITAVDRRIDNYGITGNDWGLKAEAFDGNNEVVNAFRFGANPDTGTASVGINPIQPWLEALSLDNPIDRKASNTISVASGSFTNICSLSTDPGVYIVWFHGNFSSSTKGTTRYIDLSITRNGSTVTEYSPIASPPVGGTSNTRISATVPLILETNGTITIRGFQNSGSALNVVGTLRLLKLHNYTDKGVVQH